MPRRAPRRYRRKPARKSKGRRKQSGIPRSMGLGNQMAKIVETIEFNSVAPNSIQGCVFNISQFERARTLATNFRWYKPTKVTWTIEPQFNTYQSGTGATVPYLYTIMNRSQDSSFLTLNDLLTQGAKPKKLVNQHRVTYRPNWCTPGLMVQNVVPGQTFGGMLDNVFIQGLQPAYGWLQAPNLLNPPSAVPDTIRPYLVTVPGISNTEVQNQAGTTYFNGHQFFIDQQVASGSLVPSYKITCQVHWSFKDLKNVLASATDNIFETLNDLSGNPV